MVIKPWGYALWEKIVKINHHQGEYLEKTQRKIPLVWLRRQEPPAG